MNNFQEKKIIYFLTLSELFEKRKSEVKENINIFNETAKLDAELDLIQQELISAANNAKDITTESAIAKSLVVKLCSKVSAALRIYAKKLDMNLLTKNLYLASEDYAKLSNDELLAYARGLFEDADLVKQDLVQYGVNDSDLISLRHLLDNFKEIVYTPEMMFNFRANTSDEFDFRLNKMESIAQRLEEIMQNETNPESEFYSEYLSLKETVPA